MTKKLYIGRGTGIFQNFRVIKDAVYVLEESFAKEHADMFYTADEYVAHIEQRPAMPSPLGSRQVEQATAAPGEKRVVTKPAPKKPAPKQ